MFHKAALLFNSVLLAICVVSYFANTLCTLVIFDLQLTLSGLLLLMSFAVLFLFISFLFVLISSLITDVKVGQPPFGSLVIAYKYDLSNSLNSSVVYRTYELFPTNDKVQICYERRTGPFGIAHGAVIHDDIAQVNDDTKAYLINHGYSIFYTKHISNAIYISCPTVPWFSFLGVWMVLWIVYPKIYKYSKRHRLSAYPVVELYRRFSVMLMAPLSQQDYFVVPEAEPLLHRSSSSLNTSLSCTLNTSCSTRNSMSVSVKNDNNNITKLNPVHTATSKLANGNTKQG